MASPQMCRVSLQFRHYSRVWNEVFYAESGNPSDVMTKVRNLRDPAEAPRHHGCYLAKIRVSKIGAPRVMVPLKFEPGNRAVTEIGAEETSTAVVWDLRTSILEMGRKIWFRGLRQPDLTRDVATGADKISGTLRTQIQSYITALATADLGVRALVPIDNTTVKFVNIDTITVNEDHSVTLDLVESAPVGDNNRIIISKLSPKQWPGLNGHYRVIPSGTSADVVGYYSHLAAGVYNTTGAHCRKEEYRFSKFLPASCTFSHSDRRDTKGGPSDGRGSRRPTRLRSQ